MYTPREIRHGWYDVESSPGHDRLEARTPHLVLDDPRQPHAAMKAAHDRIHGKTLEKRQHRLNTNSQVARPRKDYKKQREKRGDNLP